METVQINKRRRLEGHNSHGKKGLSNLLLHTLLQTMAFNYNIRPSLKKYLKGTDGWINLKVGATTDEGTVAQSITFQNGHVKVSNKIPEDVDVVLQFKDEDVLKSMIRMPATEAYHLILNNTMVPYGNLPCLQLFNFLVSVLMKSSQANTLNKSKIKNARIKKKQYDPKQPELSNEFNSRNAYRMIGPAKDKGIKYLDDPYLPEYCINDFPRLKDFLDKHFQEKPEVCAERAQLMTDWFRINGFEKGKNENPWHPGLRQAMSFKHVLEGKKPLIRKNDLLAGTTTSNENAGGIVYPEAHGTMIWGEMYNIDKRALIPFEIKEETIEQLHHDIFPFWTNRNFKELTRDKNQYPLSQKIDERCVAFFVWKSVGISHTIPDFEIVLQKGLLGIKDDILLRLKDKSLTPEQTSSLRAMEICLDGLESYSKNLSAEAQLQAISEKDTKRKKELEKIADICSRIPMNPANTLEEAIQALWTMWVALHQENTDTGLSLGRLDQYLQPFFENDIKKIKGKKAKQMYIKKVIELVGCFYMRCTDHFPLGPDIGNYLFGGASSTQALTLGGVTPKGENAVNDMTYIFLKVTEMLCIRDVNVNARFNLAKNSDAYLKRLCEVNFITAGTPSMHNDDAVFSSLEKHGYPIEDIRNWSATGCVEPTLTGKHMGHTGSILMNLVAGLEMAFNNGFHPLMRWQLGPKTGKINELTFPTFDSFFRAYSTQQKFLIDQAIEHNNNLAYIHSTYRPSPLLSTVMDGAIDKARDVTDGGAKYNSSGTSNIGLVDVTDSLLVIKKLVYDEKYLTFEELKKALDTNFNDNPSLRAYVQNKLRLFGSGNTEAIEMANRVAREFNQHYNSRKNFRGGPYTSGFWSMSQHVAYGNMSGTLPSGRLSGKAFTPGLTPQPTASKNFLDNILDVGKLRPENMDNNIAFNVKLIPSSHDTREKTVDTMYSYLMSYFQEGGMQMQFNVVTSETLRDAMANPENYRNLLVRISGYNAYFTTLTENIQIELIERAEYAA